MLSTMTYEVTPLQSKMPKIHPRGPFTPNYNLSYLLIKVINSSTDAAVTNITASLSVTLDKEIWSVSWPVSLQFGEKQIYKNVLPLFF